MDFVLLPVLAAVLAAVTLLSGFGLGTVLMPVFAVFFPIEVAIAATAVVHLFNNIFKVAIVGKWASLQVCVRFGLPAILAAFAGAIVLAVLAPTRPLHSYAIGEHRATITISSLLVGVLLMVFATLELLPRYQKLTLSPRLLPLGGVLSGFFGGLTGMQGALRAPFLLRAGLSKEQFVGTTAVVSTGVDVARLLVYALGFAQLARTKDLAALTHPRVIALVGLTSAAGCMGTWLGKKFLKSTTMSTIRILIAVMLFVLAALLVAGVLTR